jgi:hypothetical protein
MLPSTYSSVDLPTPDCPTIAISSPAQDVNLAACVVEILHDPASFDEQTARGLDRGGRGRAVTHSE